MNRWPFTIEQTPVGLAQMLARWLHESAEVDTGSRLSLAGGKEGDARISDKEISLQPWRASSFPKLTRTEKSIVGDKGEGLASMIKGAISTQKLGNSFGTLLRNRSKMNPLFEQFQNGHLAEEAFRKAKNDPWKFFFQLVKLGMEFGEGICRDSLCDLLDHQKKTGLPAVGYGRDFLYVWTYSVGANRPFHYLEGLSRPALAIEKANWKDWTKNVQDYFEFCTGLKKTSLVTHWDTGLNGSVPRMTLQHLLEGKADKAFNETSVRMLKSFDARYQAKVSQGRWRGIKDVVQGFEHMPKPYLRVLSWSYEVSEWGICIPRLAYGTDGPVAVALLLGTLIAGMKRRGDSFALKAHPKKYRRETFVGSDYVFYYDRTTSELSRNDGPAKIHIAGSAKGSFSFWENGNSRRAGGGVQQADFYRGELYSFSFDDESGKTVLSSSISDGVVQYDDRSEIIFELWPSRRVAQAKLGYKDISAEVFSKGESQYIVRVWGSDLELPNGTSHQISWFWKKDYWTGRWSAELSISGYTVFWQNERRPTCFADKLPPDFSPEKIAECWEWVYKAIDLLLDLAANCGDIRPITFFQDAVKEESERYLAEETRKGGF